MIIRELDKPADTWCSDCKIGVGCGIYETRPRVCQVFQCVWLQTQGTATPLPPELRPDISRVVISTAHESKDIVMNVGADRPDAWKKGIAGKLKDHWLASGVTIFVKCRDKIEKLPASPRR
jgi:hypothetical protein